MAQSNPFRTIPTSASDTYTSSALQPHFDKNTHFFSAEATPEVMQGAGSRKTNLTSMQTPIQQT